MPKSTTNTSSSIILPVLGLIALSWPFIVSIKDDPLDVVACRLSPNSCAEANTLAFILIALSLISGCAMLLHNKIMRNNSLSITDRVLLLVIVSVLGASLLGGVLFIVSFMYHY